MRLTLAIAGLFAAIFAPPWLTILCMGLLAFRYPAWEVLFIGLLTDFLWMPGLFSQLPIFTLAALVLVWGLEPLRKEFLFH
ncbi:hypothetical protein A3C86_00065 [Candidatus Kaiserbacteria bacterium RIFCSPHIGHO2_02_FULL_49_16]|uniref:Uncharacterized protein n=1 Tax=Candidatus Kaiserbacteria bacterium RIFCSPHIGHO2_02_FULL_49_16 TaxID=1798490 RepID=A0A1F6DHM2_9BACT|nr:MAG: hypothetical protein A3C86_00065 [Candidatus Kaiserbacteria bacterium RIFCSPHIGHO2_02_FULL_49_16]